MKALNRKEIFLSYLNFSKYMLFLLMAALTCLYTFFRTASVEIHKIQSLGKQSQLIFDQQLLLNEELERFLQTYQSLDLIEENKVPFLMSDIATKKAKIITSLEKISKKEIPVYSLIGTKIDGFLRTRDSINMLKKTEATYKEDVLRCSEESKNITRKMRVGKLSYEPSK